MVNAVVSSHLKVANYLATKAGEKKSNATVTNSLDTALEAIGFLEQSIQELILAVQALNK